MAETLEVNTTNGKLMQEASRISQSHDQEYCCPKRRLEVQLSEVSYRV
jgi:membrane-bound inhibitor of C-type lysozyme